MFKNMLKRAWLSTIRKPTRTIIMLVILFVMANMLLASVSIKKSVENSMDYAKEKLGGTVYLQTDTEALREKMQSARESGEDVSISTPTISKTLANGVAESLYIKDYTYSITSTANAGSFAAVETAQNERERQFQDALDSARNQVNEQTRQFNRARENFNSSSGGDMPAVGSAGGIGGGGGGGGGRAFNFSFNFDMSTPSLARGDIEILGINSFGFINGVESGAVSILDGEGFDETSEDSVVISNELATANSIAVGDTITLKTVGDNEQELVFTVSGIYQATAENFNYNTIYTNISSAEKFLTAEQLENTTVENVRYYLTSASQKDAFLAEMAERFPEIAETGLKLDIDDSSYQTMVEPIENVGGFATTIMWVIIIAAVMIITLIVAINVKDRRYEMGVLMSLGANRINIMSQIFLELVIVATLAFTLSIGTGQVLANKMGDILLQQQVTANEEEQQQLQSQNGQIQMRGQNAQGSAIRVQTDSTATIEQIKEIDVRTGANEYMTLFGAGYIILIFAMILPSISILRYQPKTILTGKE